MILPFPTAERRTEKEDCIALTSLLYVSKSTIPSAEAEEEIARIVATAHARNPGSGVTGALLFAGEHFAQVLEGSKGTVDRLMVNIDRDPRHAQVAIVDQMPIKERRFPDWSLAYFGPSQFVSRHVTRLLGDPTPGDHRRASRWLNELLREFAGSR
ncbi:MAG: BLUF domain-containing protein [Erythrobacter sp.]|nr:MAG: BLUF domain-containing protein [Erythrobacter sp.]